MSNNNFKTFVFVRKCMSNLFERRPAIFTRKRTQFLLWWALWTEPFAWTQLIRRLRQLSRAVIDVWFVSRIWMTGVANSLEQRLSPCLHEVNKKANDFCVPACQKTASSAGSIKNLCSYHLVAGRQRFEISSWRRGCALGFFVCLSPRSTNHPDKVNIISLQETRKRLLLIPERFACHRERSTT